MMESALQKLSVQEAKYSTNRNGALKQCAELKEQASGMDATELMGAGLAAFTFLCHNYYEFLHPSTREGNAMVQTLSSKIMKYRRRKRNVRVPFMRYVFQPTVVSNRNRVTSRRFPYV